MLFGIIEFTLSQSGETGRRARFRYVFPQGIAGSSPVSGTQSTVCARKFANL